MFDNIDFGIAVTVIGVILVLLVLIALNYLIKIHKALVEGQEGTGRAEARVQRPQPSVAQPSSDSADEELVAVITAAVAAVLGRSTSQIVVRSIRSLDSAAPSWAVAGRQDQISSRF